MRGLLVALGVVAILVCILVPQVNASQGFAVSEPVLGLAVSDWSFITAWDLSDGQLQASSDWFNGTYLWYYTQYDYYHWTARFVYDDGTGQTRELQWSYTQPHVQ